MESSFYWKEGESSKMDEFSHFILTRFNIRGMHGSSPPGLDWLSHRFDLFERFCFPSVSGQTNLDFKWLVFFDVDTPPAFKEKVESYAQWDRFIPIYVGDSLDKQRVIRENMSLGSKYVITTRLDNDDAVGIEFIETIQGAFSGQRFEFINLTNGYVLNLNKDRLYKYVHFSNQFTSLIESVEEFQTIYCEDHGKLLSMGKVKQLETKPLWLQVIHDRNETNQVPLDSTRVPIGLLKDDFKLDYAYAADSERPLTLHLENVLRRMRLSASSRLPGPTRVALKRLLGI